MKTHFSYVLAILTVSVAVSVHGAPPVANSETPTKETAAVSLIPSPVASPMNPAPALGRLQPGPVAHLLTANDSLGPLTPGAAFVNRVPDGTVYLRSTRTLDDSALSAPVGGASSSSGVAGVKSGVRVAESGQVPMFGPPPCCWLDLPFKTEIPAAASPPRTKFTPAEANRLSQESNLAAIRRLVREGGLSQARQAERNSEEQMGRIEMIQPYVSFSGDQINMFQTFLR
jgi:hypothetical protein